MNKMKLKYKGVSKYSSSKEKASTQGSIISLIDNEYGKSE